MDFSSLGKPGSVVSHRRTKLERECVPVRRVLEVAFGCERPLASVEILNLHMTTIIAKPRDCHPPIVSSHERLLVYSVTLRNQGESFVVAGSRCQID